MFSYIYKILNTSPGLERAKKASLDQSLSVSARTLGDCLKGKKVTEVNMLLVAVSIIIKSMEELGVTEYTADTHGKIQTFRLKNGLLNVEVKERVSDTF